MNLSQNVTVVPSTLPQISHIPQQQSREYPPEEWESKRPEIEQLYIEEDLKLEQVMEKMAGSGFLATKKQFKSRITKWKLFKNLKGDDAVWIARKQLKRKIEEDKETIFRMNERIVPPGKINRTLKRMKVQEDSLGSYESPMPSTPSIIDYCTPRELPNSPLEDASSPVSISSMRISLGRQPSAPGGIFSGQPNASPQFSWNNLSAQNGTMDVGVTRLSLPLTTFISPASRAPLLSDLTTTTTPRINAYAHSTARSNVLMHWQSEAELDSISAIDLHQGPHLDNPEPHSNLGTALATESPPAQISADVILQQAIFSPWHERFFAAAEKIEQIDFLTRSYEEAIQLANQQPENLTSNFGCRFWLARAYAYKLGREEPALALWESIDRDCDRDWDTFSYNHKDLNRLHVLTLEELSRRKKIIDVSAATHKIVSNNNDDLFGMSRKLIFLGKAMEGQKEPRFFVREVYLNVLRRCLAWRDGQPPPILFRCLGNALVALEEYDDAQCAFDQTVIAHRTLVGSTAVMYIDTDTLCDNCMTNSSSSAEDIRGFRFKCVSCAETDLCEKCFIAREQGLMSASPRSCSAEHKFMKIPGPNWSSEVLGGATLSPNLRRWLDGLCAKYQDGLYW